MDKNTTNTATPTVTASTAASVTAASPTTTSATKPAETPVATPAPTPETTSNAGEELCGSVNILDTVHLKNLVDDLAKLYGTFVCTKVARDTKVASEKRLIEAIRANLDRYEG